MMRTTRRLVLLLSALPALLAPEPARAAPPRQDPPAAEDRAPAAPPPPEDLRSIARREAEREAALLAARVDELIEDLRSTSDPEVQVIQERIGELVRIGTPALEGLFAAMNHDEGGSAEVNAGTHAARAVARLPGRDVDEALAGLARDGTRFGRRNAAKALGLRGDPEALPRLVALLEDDDEDVRRESIRALGELGLKAALPALLPFVESQNPTTAALAIESLARLRTEEADDAVLERLRAAAAGGTEWDVVEAGLEYLAVQPTLDGLDAAKELLASDAAPVMVRQAAVDALEAIGKDTPSSRKVVLRALTAATRVGLRPIVRTAALAMLALGDDSGVDAVTADYDFDLQRNPRNFNSRYKRADVYLEFRRYKAAYQDIQNGIKVEKEPRDPDRTYFALARALAGLGRYSDAAKVLRRLTTQDFSHLPGEYPEFAEMAEDSRYASVFAPPE